MINFKITILSAAVIEVTLSSDQYSFKITSADFIRLHQVFTNLSCFES